MTRPLIIGIAGGTASGKTTIVRVFAEKLGALRIEHDRYYRDMDDPERANFDHPDALETPLLVSHLDALRRGETVGLPRYDFLTHRRVDVVDEVGPAPRLIVVEGILALAYRELRDRYDLSVYVDAPDDIRLLRRMVRDIRERGRTVENVAEQYLATVRPMHERFVRPSMKHAGLVLDGMDAPEAQVARLMLAIDGVPA